MTRNLPTKAVGKERQKEKKQSTVYLPCDLS